MMFEWIKNNKNKKGFQIAVLLLILLVARIFVAVSRTAEPSASADSNTSLIEQIFTSVEDEEGNKKPLFDIHIGWGNIVVFAGLAVALIIIERKKDKSNEEQPTIHIRNRNNNDEVE